MNGFISSLSSLSFLALIPNRLTTFDLLLHLKPYLYFQNVFCLVQYILGSSNWCSIQRPFLVSLHVIPGCAVIVHCYQLDTRCLTCLSQNSGADGSPRLFMWVQGLITSACAAVSFTHLSGEPTCETLPWTNWESSGDAHDEKTPYGKCKSEKCDEQPFTTSATTTYKWTTWLHWVSGYATVDTLSEDPHLGR